MKELSYNQLEQVAGGGPVDTFLKWLGVVDFAQDFANGFVDGLGESGSLNGANLYNFKNP
jgi:hypothetical protein